MSNTSIQPVEILLVEDNPGDVRLTQEALKESKLINNLYVANDGVDAMSFLYKHGKHKNVPTPDIILLDLNLPKKDGREVLAEIKESNSLKMIPVVIMTTSTAEEDILKTYQTHANCYINKPVDFDKFIEVVKSVENFWFSIVRLPPK